MPYCSQCGNPAGDADLYCARCGARQPVPGPGPRRAEPFSGITPRAASVLCYVPVIGWIASIVVLAAEKFRANRSVRFHAFQGLYLFVAWLIVDWVITPMFRVIPDPALRFDKILRAVIFIMSVFMMVKASHEERYSLPIIGELAERSASEG